MRLLSPAGTCGCGIQSADPRIRIDGSGESGDAMIVEYVNYAQGHNDGMMSTRDGNLYVMEITVPEGNMGDIAGDLSGKRGRIQGTDILAGGMAMVTAQAPLAEVMQYQSQLKSVTGGQGSFAMEFSHYEPVPPQVQQQIAAQYKPKAEEE
jgi:hypothetical protein